jgi:hypothetical protein
MSSSKTLGIYHSPLNKLFARQQPKMKVNKRMAKLLLIFSEQDHKRIAVLIQTWLDEKK